MNRLFHSRCHALSGGLLCNLRQRHRPTKRCSTSNLPHNATTEIRKGARALGQASRRRRFSLAAVSMVRDLSVWGEMNGYCSRTRQALAMRLGIPYEQANSAGPRNGHLRHSKLTGRHDDRQCEPARADPRVVADDVDDRNRILAAAGSQGTTSTAATGPACGLACDPGRQLERRVRAIEGTPTLGPDAT